MNYLKYSLKLEKPEKYISQLNFHLQNVRNSELNEILNQKSVYTLLPEFEVEYLNKFKDGIFTNISAKIDLLYKDSNSNWHLIDYKTNKGNSSEAITNFHQYDIQIQLYIYLLKKRFEINVSSARIYYSYLNKFQHIEPSKDEILEDIIENNIKSSLPESFLETVKFSAQPLHISEYEGKNLVILTPTQSMAKEINASILNPLIKAFQLQDFIINLSRNTFPNLIDRKSKYLILKKVINDYKESDITNLPGLVDALEQAIEMFYLNDKNLSKPEHLFVTLYNSYKNYLKKHNLQDKYDIYYSLLSNPELVSKTDFQLLGEFYFDDFPIWKRMINFIKNNARSFITLSSKMVERPSKVVKFTVNEKASISYIKHLNIHNEITFTATKVYELLKNGFLINEINIILTDYERYFPILESVFPQYGIKYKTAKGKKLKSSPIYTLFDSIFKLIFEPYSFENIFKFFNNSFVDCELRGWNAGDFLFLPINISLIDSFVRRNNLSSLEKLIKNPDRISDYSIEENEINSMHTLADLINKFFIFSINKKREPKYFFEKVKEILDKFEIYKHLENNNKQYLFYKENQKSYKIILELFEDLVKSYEKLNINKINFQQFYEDFRDWCEITEYKVSDEYIGVNVLGAWESINHKAKYAFILGMAEEIFPGSLKRNFLIPELDIDRRTLKQKLFTHWQENYDEITFLYPEKDEDGNQLQKSAFLKATQEIEIDRKVKIISRREYFQSLIKHNKKCIFQNNPILENISTRAYQIENKPLSIFEGKIDNFKEQIDHYNASDLNLLARCPMKYLFQNIISLTELKKIGIEFERRDWGIFVHKVLEDFGKDGGFDKTLQQAFILMKQKVEKQIKTLHYDMNNLLIRKEYEKYISGLDGNNQNGILRNFLEVDFPTYQKFQPIEFEKSFGIDDDNFIIIDRNGKKIYISGRIDRIDKFKDNKSPAGDKYIIYDYKTGKDTFNLIKENIEFQLPIYYLKCKDEFANGVVICAFWNLIDGEPSAFLGDISEIDIKSRKRHILIVDKSSIIPNSIGEGTDKNGIAFNNIISAIKELDRKVNSGEFHYTLLERDKAHCNYCEFRKICRYDEERVGVLKKLYS